MLFRFLDQSIWASLQHKQTIVSVSFRLEFMESEFIGYCILYLPLDESMMTPSVLRQSLAAFLSCILHPRYLLCSKLMGLQMFLPGSIHPNLHLGCWWRYWICLFSNPLVPQRRSIQANQQIKFKQFKIWII